MSRRFKQLDCGCMVSEESGGALVPCYKSEEEGCKYWEYSLKMDLIDICASVLNTTLPTTSEEDIYKASAALAEYLQQYAEVEYVTEEGE